MTALEKDDWLGHDYPHQAVSEALRNIRSYEVSPETAAAARAMGNMYRVEIKADHEHFLDWDRPIGQQSEHVRSALAKLGYDAQVASSGEDAFRQLSTGHTRYGAPAKMACAVVLARRTLPQLCISQASSASNISIRGQGAPIPTRLAWSRT